ncbi:MAG: Gmad2 immunoglobulin-like domain-containing protein, partial [Pedococcus sp.]
MNDRIDFLHPDFEPGEFDRIERELRRSLDEDAGRVTPSNRLDTILHEAHAAGPVTATGGNGLRRWLAPAAAAAVVAALAGGIWLSNQDPRVTPGPPAGSPSATVPSTTVPSPSGTASGPSATDQPTTVPTTGSGTSATSSTTPPSGAVVPVALPVYFVGPIGDAKPTYKLFREFIRSELPTDATPAGKAKAALVLAINAQPYSNTDGYLQPWSGQTIGDVTVTNGLITIALANGGSPDAVVGEENKRLAVQELVWTAQAAIQQTYPVRFEVADGSTTLFGSISVDQSFTRPPAAESWKDLAPIWVTSPGRDQVVPSTSPVKVQGEASVFEATVQWELERGTTPVAKGHTMASIGAPGRGQYSIDLGSLSPGSYTVKVYEASAKDGS